MSITASNNPFPDSPDLSPTKLDKGGYDGTAETLDTKIDEILVEALLKIDGVLSESTISTTSPLLLLYRLRETFTLLV